MLVSPRFPVSRFAPRYLVVLLLRSDARAARLASASGFFRRPSPVFTKKPLGLPGSWGVVSPAPHSQTPADAHRQALYGVRLLPSASCTARARQLINNITGLYRAAHASAVYASQPSSHSSTQDSLPAGGQPSPCGIFPRVTPSDRFSFDASPRLYLLHLQASPGAHNALLVMLGGLLRRRARCAILRA